MPSPLVMNAVHLARGKWVYSQNASGNSMPFHQENSECRTQVQSYHSCASFTSKKMPSACAGENIFWISNFGW